MLPDDCLIFIADVSFGPKYASAKSQYSAQVKGQMQGK